MPAKVLTDLGHQVCLIAPQFVTPYVKSNKNDRNDAEAICEAISRPSIFIGNNLAARRLQRSRRLRNFSNSAESICTVSALPGKVPSIAASRNAVSARTRSTSISLYSRWRLPNARAFRGAPASLAANSRSVDARGPLPLDRVARADVQPRLQRLARDHASNATPLAS